MKRLGRRIKYLERTEQELFKERKVTRKLFILAKLVESYVVRKCYRTEDVRL